MGVSVEIPLKRGVGVYLGMGVYLKPCKCPSVLRSVDFEFPMLAVSINTESGDAIHIVHMVADKMKEFVDFNSRNSIKSQCMIKYSIINMINKKVLGHITTCLQSTVWGWALRWTGGVYIHILSKWWMGVSKIVGPLVVRYGI